MIFYLQAFWLRATVLRHARSPQRVRRAQDTFAQRHSESASTRTIVAEGSPGSRHIHTAQHARVAGLKMHSAQQRECFDTHAPRRGFTFVAQTLAHERHAVAVTKVTNPVAENAALATQPKKRMRGSPNAALAMESYRQHTNRRSARRRSEKKSPFHAKLSRRTTFAKTAMARSSKRSNLSRQA